MCGITGFVTSSDFQENDLDKCNEIKDEIINIDNRTWLLCIDLYNSFSKEYKEENWYKEGLSEFKNLDWSLEVDRYHLNNQEKTDSLIKLAQSI